MEPVGAEPVGVEPTAAWTLAGGVNRFVSIVAAGVAVGPGAGWLLWAPPLLPSPVPVEEGLPKPNTKICGSTVKTATGCHMQVQREEAGSGEQ